MHGGTGGSAGAALSNIAPSGGPRRRACQKKDSTPPMKPPYQTRPPRPKIVAGSAETSYQWSVV